MFPIHETYRSTVYEYYLKSDFHINFVISSLDLLSFLFFPMER